MNPSTWVSHNSLRIYGTSSSELVSAHISQATEFLLKFYYNGNWINPTSSFFIFILCGVCTTFIWPVFFFLTLPACPLAVKRLPLSINVSCNVTNPGFTLSFMDFMSVFGGGWRKKFDGQFVNSSNLPDIYHRRLAVTRPAAKFPPPAESFVSNAYPPVLFFLLQRYLRLD